MKYTVIIFMSFIFIACIPTQEELDAMSQEENAQEYVEKATPYPTATVTPYIDYQPTIDYAMTQVAYAQQTSDASLIISIQATESEAQRRQELLQMQYDYTMLTNQSNQWTVTAALTAIPLTATAQSDMSTAIAVQQNIHLVEITQTAEAPELIVKNTNAKNMEKYSFIEYLIRYTSFIVICFFLASVGIWLVKTPKVVKQEIVREIIKESAPIIIPTPDAIVEISERAETVFPAMTKMQFPCTPEQLDELAHKVIERGMSLAMDNFTGNESLFTRKTYVPVYNFMAQNKLAIGTGQSNKGLILTDRKFGPINGRDILTGWLESRTLPEGFSTLPPVYHPSPETTQTTPLLSPAEGKTGTSPLMGQLVPLGRVPSGGDFES